MAIPVQHHQSTQRSLYICDKSLFLVTIWHSSAPRVTICRSPSLMVTVGHLEAVGNDKPDPVPCFQAFHLTTNLLHHSCVKHRCHSHMNIHACILSSGISPKNVNVLHGGTCSVSSQYDRELTASVGIVSVHLRLKDSKIFYSWQGCWYQLSKSSTKTLRHLQKWNKTLIKRRIFPQAKNNL